VSKISSMFRGSLLCIIVFSAHVCFGQDSSPLPTPSGPYKVGRTSFQWVDRNRPEVMTTRPDDFREIMVYAWYPASSAGGGAASPYMPGADRLRPIAAAIGLDRLFGPSWAKIESNELRSHSVDRAPLIADRTLPLLVFVPGGGTTPIAYTTQMEEFASYGYLVVGVAHTYEAPFVLFPDGRVVTAAIDYWSRLRSEIPDSEKLERTTSDILALDVRFVIDKFAELNSDSKSSFYRRLDPARIGVFGHSRGGRTAARICQLDRRVAACLSEDGSFSWQPFWLDAAGASMRQPFMMIDHLDPELPDEAFIQMGTTREAYAANREAKRDAARGTIYKTIADGSYHLTISTPGISHNSFSDVRLLGREDSSGINIWPKDVQATTPHSRILTVVTAYARAFFDKYVRQVPAPLLEASPAMQDVEIRRYGSAAK
jgi:Platelet-activating factor acetylhydrolase, isoform II